MIWGAVGGALVAIAALGYAQVALPEQPLLSDYVLVSGGLVPVVIGMLGMAATCVFLAYGLAVREASRSAAARVLLLAGAAGLMLSAVFPTDPHGVAVKSLAGEIHRWSAAVVFTTLPVAGWMLARARGALPRWNAVRALAVTSTFALVIYLASHPASFLSPLIGGVAYYGLLERALVLAEIALLVQMSFAILREHRRPVTIPTAPTCSSPAPPPTTATGPQEHLAA
ncbi:DUF998 domain-containing protein [Nonomuraea typhae]|uniref:DUF998 domain-containing protein n=1 Tax=Nonomuraea typhae TaxID=2603600 RepID=A0ABW7YXY2_9ACTN